MDRAAVHDTLKKGVDTLTSILGTTPVCSAVPAWRCNDTVLLEKNRFPFRYNSDCRGKNVFRPVVDGQSLDQPQVPVTLPTYDEVIGRNGITNKNFNHHMIEQIDITGLNVLTIHAESEGIACLDLFEEFIDRVIELGGSFCPLGQLIESTDALPRAMVARGALPGREGWLSVQSVHG
jgi:undecaprenyl phosphate-alpha-L-ara4FN deformylase